LQSGELDIVTDGYLSNKVVVVPLSGVDSQDFESDHSNIFAKVQPRPDGVRIACLMIAKEAVALTMNAPHFADASLGDDFLVLWVFDTEILASTYSIDDDLNESMWLASAIEDDHKPLTEAEKNAWKEVAARNRHVMVSDAWDLTDKDTRLEFDSLWSS
jgi:hypothetical protein